MSCRAAMTAYRRERCLRREACHGRNLLHPQFDELSSKFSGLRAISSVVERLLHTQEVAGSNPASRTFFSCVPSGNRFSLTTLGD
jgi:hypothetical protein